MEYVFVVEFYGYSGPIIDKMSNESIELRQKIAIHFKRLTDLHGMSFREDAAYFHESEEMEISNFETPTLILMASREINHFSNSHRLTNLLQSHAELLCQHHGISIRRMEYDWAQKSSHPSRNNTKIHRFY
ncbi:MAG: hypothetical protein JJ975_06005 [Bacteroidia bacterium]|nr:hypothetical protein [Bacteroidia bacterium]